MRLFDKLFAKNNHTLIPPTNELMPEEQFWQLIQTTFSQANGNYVDQQEVMRHILRNLEPKELMRFDNRFRELRGNAYDWNLWGAIYTIHGGCFEDSFCDFRAWVISQGKAFYYNTIQDPETLVELSPAVIDIDWEGMREIPGDVFREMTGQKLSTGFVENQVLKGEEWEEFTNDLKERFPKLWAKYNPSKG